jgi:hypothetical protein
VGVFTVFVPAGLDQVIIRLPRHYDAPPAGPLYIDLSEGSRKEFREIHGGPCTVTVVQIKPATNKLQRVRLNIEGANRVEVEPIIVCKS